MADLFIDYLGNEDDLDDAKPRRTHEFTTAAVCDTYAWNTQVWDAANSVYVDVAAADEKLKIFGDTATLPIGAYSPGQIVRIKLACTKNGVSVAPRSPGSRSVPT